MMPKWHILASALLGLLVFTFTKSPAAAMACFISGTAIDLDHVLDYYLYSKRLTLNVAEISGFYGDFGKVIVVLHSYELLLIAGVVAYVSHTYLLFTGVAVGFMGHMLMDAFAYEMKPLSYFFSYRMLNGFKLERVCSTGKNSNVRG